MPTIRENASDALLHTGIGLAADREQMSRSLRSTSSAQCGYELAQSTLLMAEWVDSLLLWLSVRLRPRPGSSLRLR